MNELIELFVCLVIVFGAAVLGSVFTTPSIATWYSTLVKSPLNPPNWIFGPVWTTLFLLMLQKINEGKRQSM